MNRSKTIAAGSGLVARAAVTALVIQVLTGGYALAGEVPENACQQQYNGLVPDSAFGRELATSGEWLAVGAPYQSNVAAGTMFNGAVHVYRRNAATSSWTYLQQILPTPLVSNVLEGQAVAIDGTTLAICKSGAVEIYEFNGLSWAFVKEVLAPAGAQGFGQGLSVSGNTILLGAYSTNSFTGAAYVMTKVNGAWQGPAPLMPSGTLAPLDQFGWSVSVHGSWAFVGAFAASPLGTARAGEVHFYYDIVGQGWTPLGRLTAPNLLVDDRFGSSIAQTASRVVIGAASVTAGTTLPGRAVVFDKTFGPGPTPIVLFDAVLEGAGVDPNSQFGDAVAAAGDDVLAGAPWNVSQNGTAHLFRKSGGSWKEVSRLEPNDVTALCFGSAVGLGSFAGAETMMVGSPDKKGQTPPTPLPGRFLDWERRAPYVPYGHGCPNSFGQVACLTASGCPLPFPYAATFTVSGLAPGSTALLFASPFPANAALPGGCLLLLANLSLNAPLPAPLGQATISTSLPPLAPGTSIYLQAFVPAALPWGYHATNGLELRP